MPRSQESLEELTKEQHGFQFPPNPSERTNRKRTLTDYEHTFNLSPVWLRDYLRFLLRSTGRAVFVDLGCGDMVALVDALKLSEQIDSKGSIRAIGVDVLPAYPEAMAATNRGFKPEFIRADIDDFQFPEKADLVTLSNVLLWTRDPLKALANAAAQTRVGGIICANAVEIINDLADEHPYDSPFAGVINRETGELPGFRLENKPHLNPRELVLRKLEPIDTSADVLLAWFGNIPVLDHRINDGMTRGFQYYYRFG